MRRVATALAGMLVGGAGMSEAAAQRSSPATGPPPARAASEASCAPALPRLTGVAGLPGGSRAHLVRAADGLVFAARGSAGLTVLPCSHGGAGLPGTRSASFARRPATWDPPPPECGRLRLATGPVGNERSACASGKPGAPLPPTTYAPEPATLALVGTGLVGIFSAALRQRREETRPAPPTRPRRTSVEGERGV